MAQYEITNLPEPIDFECSSSLLRRTLQNAKNLLMCKMGEVPFDRQRGLDPAIFDLPLAEAQAQLMPELDRVMLWEPDVEVASGSIHRDTNGRTIIRCVIETQLEN